MLEQYVEIELERGYTLTALGDAAAALHYCQSAPRNMGRIIGHRELTDAAEIDAIRSSPFILYEFKPEHPRRQRYENRAELKRRLERWDRKTRPLVSRAMKLTQTAFLEHVNADRRQSIAIHLACGFRDAADFWRSARKGAPIPC